MLWKFDHLEPGGNFLKWLFDSINTSKLLNLKLKVLSMIWTYNFLETSTPVAPSATLFQLGYWKSITISPDVKSLNQDMVNLDTKVG